MEPLVWLIKMVIYVGGKTGTAESYGDKKNRINSFVSVFPTNKPKYTLFIMLENPKINKDLIYNTVELRLKLFITHLVGILFM